LTSGKVPQTDQKAHKETHSLTYSKRKWK